MERRSESRFRRCMFIGFRYFQTTSFRNQIVTNSCPNSDVRAVKQTIFVTGRIIIGQKKVISIDHYMFLTPSYCICDQMTMTLTASCRRQAYPMGFLYDLYFCKCLMLTLDHLGTFRGTIALVSPQVLEGSLDTLHPFMPVKPQ